MPVFDFDDTDAYGGNALNGSFVENVTNNGWNQKGSGTLGPTFNLQIPQNLVTKTFYKVSFRKPEYPFHNNLTTILWKIVGGTVLAGKTFDSMMGGKIAYSPVPLRTRPFRRSILSYGVRGQ